MIIVSQSKEEIVNFEQVNVLVFERTEQDDWMIKVYYDKGYETPIGLYATKERAKEVLQEIIKQKAYFELLRLAPTGGKEQAEMYDRLAKENIILDTFYIPKE